MAQTKINANGIEIGVIRGIESDDNYISLTDIAKYKNSEEPRMVITNWMSSYSTIDFLAVWEEIHNPDDFNRLEFQSVRNERGRLIMTPKQWIERMQAKGIISKAGKYGGTYAHSDIAFEFASWISPEFKLYIIKDYQRLKKKDEAKRKAIGWDEKRALSKLNYHIHTDAVQTYLITEELTSEERTYTFENEADLLNVALFGKRARDWRKDHPDGAKIGENIRDYASAEELIVLINLENFNAEWISQGLSPQERLQKLRSVAYKQTEILKNNAAKRKLGGTNPNLLKGGDKDVD